MNISIVIPVYNGGKTLKDLYSKIKKELDGYLPYEIIFIYDCGKDDSWKIIKKFAEKDKNHIRGFHFDKNYGQQSATLFGLKKASGDFIITIDEDNQHNPRFIPEMIKKLEEEKLDLIYGKFRKINQPFLKVFLSLVLRWILRIMIPDLPRDYSSYRVIRKELAVKVIGTNSHFSFLDAELGKLSSNNSCLLIDHSKRLKGSSSYSLNRLFKQLLDVLFVYSSFFRIIYITFLVFILSGFLMASYLTIILSFHLSIIVIVLFLLLFIMLLIKNNSNKRRKRKLNPIVIEQINHNK